jgi:hypothetical protein
MHLYTIYFITGKVTAGKGLETCAELLAAGTKKKAKQLKETDASNASKKGQYKLLQFKLL